MEAYLADARAKSQAGRSIWREALGGSGGAGGAEAMAAPLNAELLEEDRLAQAKADKTRPLAAGVSGGKWFLLNPAKRRIHVVRQGATRSLCGLNGLESVGAQRNPNLQGRAWQGTDCAPCDSCRHSAARQGLLAGAGRAGTRAGEAAESSSSADSSEAE